MGKTMQTTTIWGNIWELLQEYLPNSLLASVKHVHDERTKDTDGLEAEDLTIPESIGKGTGLFDRLRTLTMDGPCSGLECREIRTFKCGAILVNFPHLR